MIAKLHQPLALLLGLALLAGCSSSGSPHKTAGASKAPTTPTSARSSSAPAASFADLEKLLIEHVPAGFVLQPDNVGDTGPSNLTKAVSDDGSPGAKAALEAEGFVRGYQRLWMNPTSEQIIAFVYEFKTAAGATAYYQRGLKIEASTAPAGHETHFAINGLPPNDSIGLEGTDTNPKAAFDVAVAHTGVYVMQINCNATSSTGLKARMEPLALDQFTRLST